MIGSFVNKHPFLTVIAAAAILRLLSVIFSQGYMAHDDHFVTIRIAWTWLHDGFFLPDGTVRWDATPEIGLLRSAVYNLFQLGLIEATSAVGVQHLDIHMYFNRLVHALLSMLPVIFGYRYLKEETDQKTAIIGGLMLGAHFLIPYISVRNLVEMVAADFLFPALYFAHRSLKNESDMDACLAALLGGLAFMVRMQVCLALIAVPIGMVIGGGKWRQAVIFSVAMLVMVAMQGLLDVYTHGKFLGSVINYVTVNLSIEPTIPGPWYRYVLLILGIFVPPFSIAFVLSMFNFRVIRNHIVLWSSLLPFIVGHSIIVNKQERFIIPVFPVLIVLGCIGLYYLYNSGGFYFKWRKLRVGLWAWFWVLNTVMLVPFTFNYAHRGAVDPMVYLSRQDDVGSVLFDTSERRRFLPYSYWDHRHSNSVTLTPKFSFDDALKSGAISRSHPPSYVVVFIDGYPDSCLARLSSSLGRYELVHHGKPSMMDLVLNKLNPKYNHKNESWVLRLGE
jgi:hypothetical protein